MRISNLLASLFVMGFASQAFGLAEESVDPKATPAKDPNAFATLPEGKTLPQGVMRARYVHSKVTGNGSSYDKDGNKLDAIVELNATGGAAVVEYGISDKLSLQVQFDFVGSFETNLKEDKLKASSAWANYMTAGYSANSTSTAKIRALETQTEAFTGSKITSKATFSAAALVAIAGEAVTNGACGTVSGTNQAEFIASCVANIKSGQKSTKAFTSAVAGQISADAGFGTVVSSVADATDAAIQAGVVSQVKPVAEKKGGIGMGDTTVGVLYEAMKMDNLAIAVAGGLRYPTSNRDRAANEKPTGRGLMEIGGRFNIDYTPIPTLAFAWQNQSEVMAAPGKYNWAGQSVTVSREGVRNVGFLMIKPSLAGLSESLSFLAPKAGIAYDYDSQERMKVGSGTEAATGARASERKYLVGLGISTFDYGIPVHIDVEYRKSVEGQNISAATDSLTTQLKAYYRF
jgi:hypothetical protein